MIKKFIVVNPELFPEIIKRNECDLFTIWNVAKLIDVTGSGIVELKEVINICNKLFSLKSKYVYEKINSGINLYWTKPHGQIRNKKICLFSINKIVSRLQPNVTRTKPVSIPVMHLEGLSTKTIKEIYISIFAARYENDSPISISSLEKFLGISESTARNALKNCSFVKTKKNFEIIYFDFLLKFLILNLLQKFEILIHFPFHQLILSKF